jgi:hypothetical protein
MVVTRASQAAGTHFLVANILITPLIFHQHRALLRPLANLISPCV